MMVLVWKSNEQIALWIAETYYKEMTEKINVIFVCLGNICRSTMAEAVFNHICKLNKIEANIDSCGTAGYHIGDEPDSRTLDVLREHNIEWDHVGRQLSQSDFKEYDYIFGMDDENVRNIHKVAPKSYKGTIDYFGNFSPHDPRSNVIIHDPYYGNRKDFDKVYEQSVQSSLGFLQFLGHRDLVFE